MKKVLYNEPRICFSKDMLTRDEARKIFESGEEAIIRKLQDLPGVSSPRVQKCVLLVRQVSNGTSKNVMRNAGSG